MKKINRAAQTFALIVLISFSKLSFSQTSDLTTCQDYPTLDETLNGLVKSIVGNISMWNSNMTTHYLRLTVEEQQQALSYMASSDKALLDRFPQFGDIEIQNGISAIKNSYSAALARFGELYPTTNNEELAEKLKTIIKCCAAKVTGQQLDESGNRVDPCGTVRKNCLVSATAQATIGHLGCASLDLTIIAGIICHAAVFAYQVSESNICESNYKQCKQGG